MSNTLQWVYNHIDPDFVTTIALVIGIAVFLHAIVCHGKTNEKRPNMVLGIGFMVFAAWNVNNTLWHNVYATYEPRSGHSKVIAIGSDIYMIDDSDLSRIILNKVDLYDPSFARKFKETYGDSGRADDILMVDPRPKELSLDYKEPTKITSK